MRVSIDQDGFRCYGTAVYLDGVAQTDVITADEDRGYIVRFSRGEDGRLRLDDERTGILTEQLSGAVRVDLPPHYWT